MKILKKICGERIDLILREVCEEVPEKSYVEAQTFDIVLKNAKVIGSISARIGSNEFTYYCGSIGFGIDEAFRGNGYAVEAVRLVKVVFLKNGLNKILISNVPTNNASARVCEKLGAKFIEKAKLPSNYPFKTDKNQKYMNIWKLKLK